MSDTILVPVTTVQPDLVTQTDVVVYVPLASKTSPGIVQIGEGLNIDNGIISVIPVDVPIKSISKNGTLIIPNENKNVNIILNKSDVGLSAVDNTSDLDKPISNATQQAINNVENDVDGLSNRITDLSNNTQQSLDDLKTTLTDNIFDVSENLKLHIGDKDNPHEVTKAQVGLSNVDNTSDKNKPISDAAKQALDTKMDKSGGIFTGNVGVQGNLSVSGTIITKDTETLKVQDNVIVTNANKIELLDLSGLAINKNDTQTYGIMYDAVDDSVKLGLGSIDSDGKFTFNEGEGSPVATRSDSGSLTDNHLIKWDATNNKLVDSGYSAEDKLDKIINTDIYNRVYGINSDGTQTTYNVSVQPEKDSIVCRDYYGRIGSETFYANYINNLEDWDTNPERRTHITLEPKSFEMVSYVGSQVSGLKFTNDTDTNSDDMSIFGEFMGSKTTPDYAKQIGFSMNYNNVSYLENGITLRVLENLQNGKILSLTQNGLFIGDGFDAIPEGEQTLPLKNKKEISPNTIRYDIEQTLTDEQKAQARANIGAGTGGGTGGGTTVTVGGVAQETWDADSKVNKTVDTYSINIDNQGINLINSSDTAVMGMGVSSGGASLTMYTADISNYIGVSVDDNIKISSGTSEQNTLMLLQPNTMEIGHTKGDKVHKLLVNENGIGIYDKVVVDGNTLQGVVNAFTGMAAIQAFSDTSGGGITVQPNIIEIETPKLTYNGSEVATTSYIDNISNPNLLINGDFRVNQRGQTSYTGTGYTVDRWRNAGFTNLVTTPINTGISLVDTVDTSTGYVLSYKFEDKDYLKLQGKTITISCKVSKNTGSSIYLRLLANGENVGDTANITDTGIFSKTITLPTSLTSLELHIRKSSGELNCEIEYVKLELGSVVTANNSRPYVEELAMCQRYYQRIRYFKNARTAYDYYDPYINFYIPMRISPTIISLFGVNGNGVVSTNLNTVYIITTI